MNKLFIDEKGNLVYGSENNVVAIYKGEPIVEFLYNNCLPFSPVNGSKMFKQLEKEVKKLFEEINHDECIVFDHNLELSVWNFKQEPNKWEFMPSASKDWLYVLSKVEDPAIYEVTNRVTINDVSRFLDKGYYGIRDMFILNIALQDLINQFIELFNLEGKIKVEPDHPKHFRRLTLDEIKKKYLAQ